MPVSAETLKRRLAVDVAHRIAYLLPNIVLFPFLLVSSCLTFLFSNPRLYNVVQIASVGALWDVCALTSCLVSFFILESCYAKLKRFEDTLRNGITIVVHEILNRFIVEAERFYCIFIA